MIRELMRGSFYQLLIIYTILIFLISIGTFSSYTLHFEIFALILAVFGALSVEKKSEVKIPSELLILPFLVILISRLYPYFQYTVPLGYDPGIYKYIMEAYQQNMPEIPLSNLDLWVRSSFPPGLFILTDLLYLMGLDTHALLTWGFIFFELLLGLGMYAAAGKFFGKDVGMLSLLIYSISIVQFKVFWYLYYKNVVALFVMLIALYLLKSGKYLPFILTSAFIGALHRPTFLIFGFVYLAYIVVSRKDVIKNAFTGAVILALALTFYLPNMKEAIISNIDPIVTANIGAGTFISLFEYQFTSLSYLPFALFGFLALAKKRDWNLFFLWFVISGIIVYFELIFFNRFIIHLDVALIILAALGSYELLTFNKKFGTAVLFILFFSSLFMMNQNVHDTKPLINESELNIIEQFNHVERDASVMSTSSYYSPWILGYSGRKTIAPGLFDYDRWNFTGWETFLKTGEKEVALEMLKVYEKPVYIYLGERARNTIMNETKFENECFDKVFQENEIKIYKLAC